VEILGDVQNRLPSGAWSAPPQLERDTVRLAWEGHDWPVVSLTALRAAYVAMNHPQKVALIDAI
jgi:hypothetical protein